MAQQTGWKDGWGLRDWHQGRLVVWKVSRRALLGPGRSLERSPALMVRAGLRPQMRASGTAGAEDELVARPPPFRSGCSTAVSQSQGVATGSATRLQCRIHPTRASSSSAGGAWRCTDAFAATRTCRFALSCRGRGWWWWQCTAPLCECESREGLGILFVCSCTYKGDLQVAGQFTWIGPRSVTGPPSVRP